MFENGKPIPRADSRDADERDLPFGSSRAVSDNAEMAAPTPQAARAGDALRAIEWGELTARLNAARDLRRELRHDFMLCAGSSGARFGDAAASFFKALGNGEGPVNFAGLEACKTSRGNVQNETGAPAQGDARDNV